MVDWKPNLTVRYKIFTRSSLTCQSVYITGSKTINLIACLPALFKIRGVPLIAGNFLNSQINIFGEDLATLLSHNSSRLSCFFSLLAPAPGQVAALSHQEFPPSDLGCNTFPGRRRVGCCCIPGSVIASLPLCKNIFLAS